MNIEDNFDKNKINQIKQNEMTENHPVNEGTWLKPKGLSSKNKQMRPR